MGDRAQSGKISEVMGMEGVQKTKKRRERENAEAESAASLKSRQRRLGESDFLASLESLEATGAYQPRTKETRAAFELVLTFVQRILGDQPTDILSGTAVELLSVMKMDEAVESQKAGLLSSLLGAPLSQDDFHKLTALSNAITDFSTSVETTGGTGTDEIVAITRDEEEEEEEEEEGGGGGGEGGGVGFQRVVVPLDDEDEEDRGDNSASDGGVGGGIGVGDAASLVESMNGSSNASKKRGSEASSTSIVDEEEEERAGLIPVSKIDAFWLQRELSKYYTDALECVAMSNQVLEILGSALGTYPQIAGKSNSMDEEGVGGGGGAAPQDMRLVENRLVSLLEFDKFDTVKLLMKNVARVYYCTRLGQAQTDVGRDAVREAMAADYLHGGPAILSRLDAKLSSAGWSSSRAQKAREKVQKEAQALKAGGAAQDSNAIARSALEGGDQFSLLLSGGTATVIPGGASSDSRKTGGPSSSLPFHSLPPPASSTSSSTTTTTTSGQSAANPLTTLDLDSLAFSGGARTMSNKKVVLSENSWRIQKPGYEEVHVPALKPRPFAAGEVEVPIKDLPPWAQPAFAGMTKLNRVQSKLAPTALGSSENMLLCAPTGAGKTNVAVLSIMHELGRHLLPTGDPEAASAASATVVPLDLSAFKIVYIAPMKALVQEVVANLSQRLSGPYGITVRELSGDSSLTKAEIASTQIIVTTPEKWDVVTRKAGERSYTALVRLVIIDEVHLLHDERGAVLEALVARILRGVESNRDHVRIVGLSATLPNFEDVATFLRVKPDTGLFYFDGSFRPCPLQQQYIGITEKKSIKRLALLNEICYTKVEEQAGKSQVLVFVHTRKDTGRTARALKDAFLANDTLSKLLREDSASREILQTESENSVRDAELKELLPYGIAIHHAGMPRSDRTLVEELFADGHTQVLVSTATLAWGVNLPAHTVIIKGTQVYNPEKGKWSELSPLDVMQMLGRAGRPQFDTFGEGIIITNHSELQYYLSLLNHQLPIESQLIARLPDTLNAEIVAGGVTNVREAATWLSYTYLYVRMLRAPELYGVQPASVSTDPSLYQRRLDLVHSALLLLDKHNLVRYERRSGGISPTALGRVASYYYLTHTTLATFNTQLKPTLSDLDVLRVFSLAGEFKNLVVRVEEKDELRRLLERVPIPVKEGMEEASAKVNVLLQAYVSRLSLEGLAIRADMVYIQQSAGRLVRAMFEISLRRCWASLARKALALSCAIERRQWPSATPLRQFSVDAGGLPEETLRRLEKAAVPWTAILDLSPMDLGTLVRQPKLGKPLHRLVHSIPRLEVVCKVLPISRTLLRLSLTLTPDFVYDTALHGPGEEFWVFVEDGDSGENLLACEHFYLKARYAEEDNFLSILVPCSEPLPPHLFLRVLSNKWLHSESLHPIPLLSLTLPTKPPPPRELLDLAPLPVRQAAAGSALLGALFPAAAEVQQEQQKQQQGHPLHSVRYFNPIQTQTFPPLFNTDASVYIAAPSGSGKTVCAEFALARLFTQKPGGRAVYIAPNTPQVRARFLDWASRLSPLGLSVVELTGELQADLKLLKGCHLACATASQWDALSRGWRKRRVVTEVDLYIADQLHFLGEGEGGAVYEVVVTRIRRMLVEGGVKSRLLGLASSTSNSGELGDWLGVAPSENFAFHPATRPLPLEVRIQGFDTPDSSARLLSMARPMYAAVCGIIGGGGALVFTPSRRQAQLSAIDLLSFARHDGAEGRFIPPSPGAAAALTLAVESAVAAGVFSSGGGGGGGGGVGDGGTLAEALASGVGYTYEGQPEGQRVLVERLFSGGLLSVCCAQAGQSWGMDSCTWGAAGVVILSTEAWDGVRHSEVEYSTALMLHMTGRAVRVGGLGGGTRSQTTAAAVCVILCSGARKEGLKKLLYEPLPVESNLPAALADHVNAEIVAESIHNAQDALDYLTWTFLYRRIQHNPNYYGIPTLSPENITAYLSDLVEDTVGDLSAGLCVSYDENAGGTLAPLNLGIIASYYYTTYTTLEVFASSITARSKLKGILEILSNATELAALPVRGGDEKALARLAHHTKCALPPLPATARAWTRYADPHTKSNLLLQAHFSRGTASLSPDLARDCAWVVERCPPLLSALVDVISSEGWLKPALATMELCQMVVQGVWADAPSAPLLQVPHFTTTTLERLCAVAERAGVPLPESVFDLTAMDSSVRVQGLEGLSQSQLEDVARFCNRYPAIDVVYTLEEEGGGAAVIESPQTLLRLPAGEPATLKVTLSREVGAEGMSEGAGLGAVVAPLFPKPKTEGWWLVLGIPSSNSISAIRRLAIGQTSTTVKLSFTPPVEAAGAISHYKLYLMSDS